MSSLAVGIQDQELDRHELVHPLQEGVIPETRPGVRPGPRHEVLLGSRGKTAVVDSAAAARILSEAELLLAADVRRSQT